MFEFMNTIWGTAYIIAGGIFGIYAIGLLLNAYFSFKRNQLLGKQKEYAEKSYLLLLQIKSILEEKK